MSKAIKIIKTTLDTGRYRISDAADGLNDLEEILEENHTNAMRMKLKTVIGNLLVQRGKFMPELKVLNLAIRRIY